MAKHYCNSDDLEEWWAGWLATADYDVSISKNKKGKEITRLEFRSFGDERNWEKMSEMLYSICLGIAKKFRPGNDDEYYNLANEAMIKLMNKIVSGKLSFKPRCQGGSPVFNLVTTTVQRILFSYKNDIKRKKIRHSEFVLKTVKEKAPELLSSVKTLYEPKA